MRPDARLLYFTWGIAWIVGFSAMYFAVVPATRPPLPLWFGATIGAASLALGIAVSAIHSTRRAHGSRGPSRAQGTIYGNSYAIAFTILGLLGARMGIEGVPLVTMLPYWVAIFRLIVGILALTGALIQNDRSQLVFGSWTLLVGLGSIAIPGPYVVLAGIVGGVGFVGLAVIAATKPALVSGTIGNHPDE